MPTNRKKNWAAQALWTRMLPVFKILRRSNPLCSLTWNGAPGTSQKALPNNSNNKTKNLRRSPRRIINQHLPQDLFRLRNQSNSSKKPSSRSQISRNRIINTSTTTATSRNSTTRGTTPQSNMVVVDIRATTMGNMIHGRSITNKITIIIPCSPRDIACNSIA